MRSIPRIKSEWKLKSPKQKWCYLYSILNISFRLMKFPVYGDTSTKLHWFSYYYYYHSFISVMLMLYTFYYYLSRGDIYSCLPCTCICGMIMGVCISRLALPNFFHRLLYSNELLHFEVIDDSSLCHLKTSKDDISVHFWRSKYLSRE